jgi:hypothetical protein
VKRVLREDMKLLKEYESIESDCYINNDTDNCDFEPSHCAR